MKLKLISINQHAVGNYTGTPAIKLAYKHTRHFNVMFRGQTITKATQQLVEVMAG